MSDAGEEGVADLDGDGADSEDMSGDERIRGGPSGGGRIGGVDLASNPWRGRTWRQQRACPLPKRSGSSVSGVAAQELIHVHVDVVEPLHLEPIQQQVGLLKPRQTTSFCFFLGCVVLRCTCW